MVTPQDVGGGGANRLPRFVKSTNGKLELYFLPSYSPELNPDEQVWNHVKRHQVGKRFVTGPDQFKKLVIRALRRLQKLPDVVRGFFHHPENAYTLEPNASAAL